MKIQHIISALFILFATSCATLPSAEQLKSETQNYSLPIKPRDKNALIYIVRPSQVGTLVRFNVFLDDKQEASEMGHTRGNNFIYFFVAPGKHTILSKAENWAQIDIDAKADEVIFIKQNAQAGFIMARNSLGLINELEGKYYVKNTQVGTILKEIKN